MDVIIYLISSSIYVRKRIVKHLAILGLPQENGVAEKMNRILVAMVRSMIV